MEPTVYILFKGITLFYEKGAEQKILFPFDDCHSVKFTVIRKAGDEWKATFKGHLGNTETTISITTESANAPDNTSTNEFKNYVLDLTAKDLSEDAVHMPTHTKLEATGDWHEKGVLMSIQDIKLDVFLYLHNFPETHFFDIFLTDGRTMQKIENPMAHTVYGKISLKANGTVKVSRGTKQIFASEPGETCTLVFDNDCKEARPGKNDMDMLYNVVKDGDAEQRRFRIVGRKKDEFSEAPVATELVEKAATAGHLAPLIEILYKDILTGPPSFSAATGDKPCLAVQVKESDDLPLIHE